MPVSRKPWAEVLGHRGSVLSSLLLRIDFQWLWPSLAGKWTYRSVWETKRTLSKYPLRNKLYPLSLPSWGTAEVIKWYFEGGKDDFFLLKHTVQLMHSDWPRGEPVLDNVGRRAVPSLPLKGVSEVLAHGEACSLRLVQHLSVAAFLLGH